MSPQRCLCRSLALYRHACFGYTNSETGAVEGTLTYTIVEVCSGHYGNGKLSYIETVTA